MKKIYLNPELEVVSISTSLQMLAGSLEVEPGEETGSGELNDGDAEEDAMGRYGFGFDE